MKNAVAEGACFAELFDTDDFFAAKDALLGRKKWVEATLASLPETRPSPGTKPLPPRIPKPTSPSSADTAKPESTEPLSKPLPIPASAKSISENPQS